MLRKLARLPDYGAGQHCHYEIQNNVEDESALYAEPVGYGRHEEWECKRAYSAPGGDEADGSALAALEVFPHQRYYQWIDGGKPQSGHENPIPASQGPLISMANVSANVHILARISMNSA